MNNKDWKGNSASYSTSSGFANLREGERQENDFYATSPVALEKLLDVESFSNVWECACGLGHLSNVLKERNIFGRESDLIDRCGNECLDFLSTDDKWEGDIITNPPYKYATEFVYKSLNVINDGNKVAMIFPQRYLSSKGRYKLFTEHPPKYVYAFSGRVSCAMNGDFNKYSNSVVDYCWIIWEKGFSGDTILKWIY